MDGAFEIFEDSSANGSEDTNISTERMVYGFMDGSDWKLSHIQIIWLTESNTSLIP